jgi:hypothetical protein
MSGSAADMLQHLISTCCHYIISMFFSPRRAGSHMRFVHVCVVTAAHSKLANTFMQSQCLLRSRAQVQR